MVEQLTEPNNIIDIRLTDLAGFLKDCDCHQRSKSYTKLF